MKKIFLGILLIVTTNVLTAQVDSASEEEVKVVQKEAQFPGGLPAWRKYLEQNLNADLADSCLTIPKGKTSVMQTVIVSFRVDRNGKITDVRAENKKDVHPLLAAEAIRVIKNGPDWIPAQLNKRKVIYRQRQPITWVLEE